MKGKKRTEPFKSFETEEEWREAVSRIVDLTWEKISARFPNLAEFMATDNKNNDVNNAAGRSAERDKNTVKAKSETKNTKALTQREMDSRVMEVRRQAEEMKAKYPDFDMERELEDKNFCYLVFKLGVDVEDAYLIMHRNEVQRVKEVPRISENGATKHQGISTKLNPEKFSDEDVAKILERIQNGEQITF